MQFGLQFGSETEATKNLLARRRRRRGEHPEGARRQVSRRIDRAPATAVERNMSGHSRSLTYPSQDRVYGLAMVRRSLRAGLWLGLLAGMVWALRRAMLLRRVSESVEVSNDPWSPITQPVAEPVVASEKTWVEPQDGACPATHPIKVKLASGIFHLPGMLAYDRTRPDRCYATEADAIADGFVKAKR